MSSQRNGVADPVHSRQYDYKPGAIIGDGTLYRQTDADGEARPSGAMHRVVSLREPGFVSKKKWAAQADARYLPSEATYCVEDPVEPAIDTGTNLQPECVHVFQAECARARDLLRRERAGAAELTEVLHQWEPSCSVCRRAGLSAEDFSKALR